MREEKVREVRSGFETAKWLKKDELDSVEWLPADVTLVEKIRSEM